MNYRFWIGEILPSDGPKTSDLRTQNSSLPLATPRVARPSEVESHVVSYWVASSR